MYTFVSVHNVFGFGFVNASKAIYLAQEWKTGGHLVVGSMQLKRRKYKLLYKQ